ncbi:pirin family protein [Nakamurella deserti]|uniref:pirin family protein n=1 Tax=Nakamurella deserti TaxID=2164074 RepID=UPI00197C7449|nr:pirin family protein [Nakamurella deserti]
MSNLESAPVEHDVDRPTCGSRLLKARAVPLGGVRAMTVRRTLPSREIPLIGAWCFLDEMGPESAGMTVLPHPHIGLQTVTWPLSGEIRHRDGLGSDVVLRPGELNIMTSGRGIAHSEVTAPGVVLHGLQLWVALPADAAGGTSLFEQHRELPVFTAAGVRGVVFVGELGEVRSPATIFSPLVGAELVVEPGSAALPLRADFEYGVLVVGGTVEVDGRTLEPGPLLYLAPGRTSLDVSTTEGARLVLLGGEPFADELVMWWNFVGRTHEEIVAARDDWEAHDPRFGPVDGHGDERIPAPPLPPLRLTPRRRG